jgi:hypothetical protein
LTTANLLKVYYVAELPAETKVQSLGQQFPSMRTTKQGEKLAEEGNVHGQLEAIFMVTRALLGSGYGPAKEVITLAIDRLE